MKLAVCKLYPAVYGLPGMQSSRDILTATSQPQTELAVDISEFDTKLVTARDGNKLFGLLHHNTSGMA